MEPTHAERDEAMTRPPHRKHRKERERSNSAGSERSDVRILKSKSSEDHGSQRGRTNVIRNVDVRNGSGKGKVMTGQNNVFSASSDSKYSKDNGCRRAESTSIPNAKMEQGMFNRSQNMVITGGNFTNVIPVYERRGLKLLTKRVAHSAFHNSAQRIDPPRCHPKTREELLDTMFVWIMDSEHRNELILWLNGAAGGGKSAIMQTLAERCVDALIAVASFFFSRTDSTRNSIDPLVATLAYQLIQAIPEVSNFILHIVEENPLIFDQAVEFQLQQLIVQPFLRLPADLRCPFVVFIDGLDECVDHAQQATLIKVFGDISQKCNGSIIFLIASRREPQIETAFGRKHVTGILRTIPLDELSPVQTSSDIRSYLTDKFDEIKKTHPRREYLSADWPPKLSIEKIVDKSSGQFIYASVVMNFASIPDALPSNQLFIIENIRPRDPEDNPFANLDALYQYIFSKVKHLDIVKSIFAMMLAKWASMPIYIRPFPSKITEFEALFSLQAGDLESLLANLAAVVRCVPNTPPEVKILHASLADFLLDQSRSGEYFVDLEERRSRLLCIFFESNIPDKPYYSEYVKTWRIYAIDELLTNAKATAPLQHSILNFRVQNSFILSSSYLHEKCILILYLLRNLVS
ncbi:hypothetical protein BDN70DRAFT_956939 [Pholiota conissans]|uniref:Nephrocystin 3-like N-terminal domain-containing protein n=1 Tax=Pholiota conissans TaxID=109636 RepID=A0A9P5YV57_9AGAR|nr:hypothetical protein BDN70DRAFT_956939 [Pholiota conissans]